MSLRYFIVYARDFANTYTVYVVADPDVAAFRTATGDAEEITREQAIERGRERPNAARKSGEHWPGGFATYGEVNPALYQDDERCIEEARLATLVAIHAA